MTSHSLLKLGPAALTFIALAFGVAAVADELPLPPTRPPEFSTPARAPEEPGSQAPTGGAAQACLAKLIANGAVAEQAPAPATSTEGCGIDAPIRLSSITVMGAGVVSLPDRPLLDCEFAIRLSDYVRLIVAPLGEAILRDRAAAIETGPGYECRTQDRIAGAKISAHAKGRAVDFVSITFGDKRRILVERQTSSEEATFLRAVRTAACGWFTTVLGPGADAFHATNIHLDAEQHGSSGSYRICQ